MEFRLNADVGRTLGRPDKVTSYTLQINGEVFHVAGFLGPDGRVWIDLPDGLERVVLFGVAYELERAGYRPVLPSERSGGEYGD